MPARDSIGETATLIAAQISRSWLGTPHGRTRIRGIIEPQIERAHAASDHRHADVLRRALAQCPSAEGEGI